ncbi:MAG: hypothetical protein ACIALR_10760 [Blastopirellula sp. JB062]
MISILANKYQVGDARLREKKATARIKGLPERHLRMGRQTGNLGATDFVVKDSQSGKVQELTQNSQHRRLFVADCTTERGPAANFVDCADCGRAALRFGESYSGSLQYIALILPKSRDGLPRRYAADELQ